MSWEDDLKNYYNVLLRGDSPSQQLTLQILNIASRKNIPIKRYAYSRLLADPLVKYTCQNPPISPIDCYHKLDENYQSIEAYQKRIEEIKKKITIAQHNISGSNIVISNETERAQSLSVQIESDYALKTVDELRSTNQSLKEEIIQYNNELLELTTQRNTFETSLKQHLIAIETLYQTLNISKTELFKDLKKIAAREDFFFIDTLKQSTLWQCLAIHETLFTTENSNPSYFVKMLLNDNIKSLIELLALYPDNTKANINKPLKTPSNGFTSKTTTSKVFFLTPLFLAAYFGKLNLIKVLVESYNADLNLACTFNFSDSTTFTHITPLQIAVMFGHKPAIKYLKWKGAKTNTFVNKQHTLTFALVDAKTKDVTHFDFYETALNNILNEEVFACQIKELQQPNHAGYTPAELKGEWWPRFKGIFRRNPRKIFFSGVSIFLFGIIYTATLLTAYAMTLPANQPNWFIEYGQFMAQQPIVTAFFHTLQFDTNLYLGTLLLTTAACVALLCIPMLIACWRYQTAIAPATRQAITTETQYELPQLAIERAQQRNCYADQITTLYKKNEENLANELKNTYQGNRQEWLRQNSRLT